MRQRFAALLGFSIVVMVAGGAMAAQTKVRVREDFGKGWRFHLGDVKGASEATFDDSGWRLLRLPHDWSIEGDFSPDHPATPGGGALPGGIGWYRKSFELPGSWRGKRIFVDFDGVYRNSDVWINGHHLGFRPYGYSSFRYELTPYLRFGRERNVLAVRVDNSLQPDSRWYTGSGIYRNVWLVVTEPVYVDHWGTYITTPEVSTDKAKVVIRTKIRNASGKDQNVRLRTDVLDPHGKRVGRVETETLVPQGDVREITQEMVVHKPELWSVERPALYQAVSQIIGGGRTYDDYVTTFGIRTFTFDREKGFFLNGQPMKILGVCNHHDLGCLGAAVNVRAIERQLEILKKMGANAIRTAHNPPAPELLDLCDAMGFLVMDEAFDMWKKPKTPYTPYGYSLWWDEWHRRDLEDMVLRDRNHPSVIIWSIGNEIVEQWDSTGISLARELADIVRNLDPTRPITSACNYPKPDNFIIRSGALDLIGFNYHHREFEAFLENFPGQKFIASETNSALATRGHYDMPSDSIRVWPVRGEKRVPYGNPDYTCSSYDNCHAPWGSTHEATWKVIRKHAFLSGMFIWSGFDYLGEPTPYWWPARSSYFGVIDLAGFPKDAYYFYQAEWTKEPVLHVFPHWNWEPGDTVDVWAYTNCEEVELFLNGVSQGVQRKSEDRLHLMWRLAFTPGTLRAVGRTGGKVVLTREIRTAGPAAKVVLQPDRTLLRADGKDLCFVTVRIEDKDGNLVPKADNLVQFQLQGEGEIAGVDNGCQTSHEPFRAHSRKAFNGLCLVVVRTTEKPGRITLTATSEGLAADRVVLRSR